MDIKNYSPYLIFILLWICHYGHAQESVLSSVPLVPQSVQYNNTDTTISVESIKLAEDDLNQIPDIRSEYMRQNESYTRPSQPSQSLLRFLNKDKLKMSEEALYWMRMIREASNTYDENAAIEDRVIVNPLFLPLVFYPDVLPDTLNFYDPDFYKPDYPSSKYVFEDRSFDDYKRKREMQRSAYRYIAYHNPTAFKYSHVALPDELIEPVKLRKDIAEDLPIIIEPSPVNVEEIDAPLKFIPERQYWTSGFESAVQFSQNYISPNWHKGGSSNLNIFTKNHLEYNYNKDKVQFTNYLDLNLSIYNSTKDTIHHYRIGEDLFRLHSNIGYQAYNNWYYTFDAEFATQFFQNFKENSNQKQAAFLAPYIITFGLGMKYDLDKQFAQKHRSVKLSINMAPVSYKYMYSRIKDPEELDLGRHGFSLKEGSETEYEHVLSQFGSTLNASLTFNFTRNVSWQSRLYYFTSYDRVQAEFENTLVMAINRFFSTRIYVNVRFDDAATKTEDFDSYFQINEILSFGFNYKW